MSLAISDSHTREPRVSDAQFAGSVAKAREDFPAGSRVALRARRFFEGEAEFGLMGGGVRHQRQEIERRDAERWFGP